MGLWVRRQWLSYLLVEGQNTEHGPVCVCVCVCGGGGGGGGVCVGGVGGGGGGGLD